MWYNNNLSNSYEIILIIILSILHEYRNDKNYMVKIPMLKSHYIYKEILLNNFFRHFRKYSIKLKLTLQSSNWHYECYRVNGIRKKRQRWHHVIIVQYPAMLSIITSGNDYEIYAEFFQAKEYQIEWRLRRKKYYRLLLEHGPEMRAYEFPHVACMCSRVMSSRISGLTREVRMWLWAW